MITVRLFDDVGDFAGDKDVAARVRQTILLPAMAQVEPVVLDFDGIELATQSFIHALISELVRSDEYDALDLLDFRNCTLGVRELIGIVAEYSQEDVLAPGEAKPE